MRNISNTAYRRLFWGESRFASGLRVKLLQRFWEVFFWKRWIKSYYNTLLKIVCSPRNLVNIPLFNSQTPFRKLFFIFQTSDPLQSACTSMYGHIYNWNIVTCDVQQPISLTPNPSSALRQADHFTCKWHKVSRTLLQILNIYHKAFMILCLTPSLRSSQHFLADYCLYIYYSKRS